MNRYYFLLAVPILMAACTQKIEEDITIESDASMMTKAVATIIPLGDSGVSGTVSFTRAENGVVVEAQIRGLSAGDHGFHIHEFGDCTASNGTSAGGHFNPSGQEHGNPEADIRHMGDMGNLSSQGPEQVTSFTYTDSNIRIPFIIGRGIIVHAGQDDLTSQPSGAAGSRIACGVIGITQ